MEIWWTRRPPGCPQHLIHDIIRVMDGGDRRYGRWCEGVRVLHAPRGGWWRNTVSVGVTRDMYSTQGARDTPVCHSCYTIVTPGSCTRRPQQKQTEIYDGNWFTTMSVARTHQYVHCTRPTLRTCAPHRTYNDHRWQPGEMASKRTHASSHMEASNCM